MIKPSADDQLPTIMNQHSAVLCSVAAMLWLCIYDIWLVEIGQPCIRWHFHST